MFSSTREARSAPRPQRFRPTCRSFHPLGGPRVHLFNPKSPRRSTKRRPEGVRPPDARRRVTVGDGGAVRCAVRRDPAGRQPSRHNRPRPVFRPLTATKQRAPADGPAPGRLGAAGPGPRSAPPSAAAAAAAATAAGRTAPAGRAASAGVAARARVARAGVAAHPPAASAVGGPSAPGTPATGPRPPLRPGLGLRRPAGRRPPHGQQPSDDDHDRHCRDEDAHAPHRPSSPEARSPVASPSMCERGIPPRLARQSALEQVQSFGPGWRS